MDVQREMIRHMLATLAYRTQKALGGADDRFPDFSAGNGVRTPTELIRHMSAALGYARTFFIGCVYEADPLPSFSEEVQRFYALLVDLSDHLAADTDIHGITLHQLLQGPISDVMTDAGQLAILRRLAGSPVASENLLFAAISIDSLGSSQPSPAAPDAASPRKRRQFGRRLGKFLNRG